ncbi:MAG: carboxypeptidase regulatory-like domain-containing protein [Acidobacteria bacterium]|nr:carboxypeptidase regulatory-like domain-containing protein [Acidobacteriota bacterium]
MNKFLVFCLIGALAMAQEYRATLLGQVVDSSGAAIPQATIKATREGTNVAKETVTNNEGIYTIMASIPAATRST